MILVLGSQGQLGSAFARGLKPWVKTAEHELQCLSRDQADLSKPDLLLKVLNDLKPSVVINAAAYTAVDLAETETEKAWAINATAPGVLARWCQENGALLVHFSTDYVFSGEGEAPWSEEDPLAPLGVYGQSKLAGENEIVKVGGRFLIFRTSWVYDSRGKNFFRTMLGLGAQKQTLSVVDDQVGAPTYAPHLAYAVIQILVSLGYLSGLDGSQGQTQGSSGVKPRELISGIYHLCQSGQTSWYGFASTIFDQAKAQGLNLSVQKVEPVTSDQYVTVAKRPKNSRLSLTKVQKTYGVSLPDWRIGVLECMKEYCKTQS